MENKQLKLRESAAAWRQDDDETVVLDLMQDSYYAVNRTGSVLWEMLSAGTTELQMSERLVQLFGLSMQHAADDVAAFVGRCVELGYVDA